MKKLTLFILTMLLLAQAGFSGGISEEEKKLKVALSGNPDTLDPHGTSGTLTFQTIKSIYDTLVEPDESGKIVPALATGWTVSEDQLKWTFTLREGVTFHNGDDFTSKDVKATFLRMLDEEKPGALAVDFKVINGIKTPDAMTVVFELSEPFSPLLSSFASGWGAILPAKLIENGHNFAEEPVGTGPFVFQSWTKDSSIVCTKNDNYWMEGKPAVDGLEFIIIPERSVQLQGLLSGDIDISFMLDVTDLAAVEDTPEVEYKKALTSLVMVMTINTSRPYLSDLKVRQAMAHAINRQQALDSAYGGGIPVGSFMDASDAYYKDFSAVYPYDPEKSRRLLEEANLDDSVEFEMVLPQNYEPHVRAGEIYQEMLRQVGINVKIKLVDWGTWISDVYRNSQFDLTVIGHTGKLDPNGRLSGYGTDEMYVKWENPEVAELIKKATEVSGFDERKALYDEILATMAKELPFVFVGSNYRYIGTRKNIRGFRMDPKLDTLDFRNVTVGE